MLDALDPFVRSLKSAEQTDVLGEVLLAAVEQAQRLVEGTAKMIPRLGRSSYIGDRMLGYPNQELRPSSSGCAQSQKCLEQAKHSIA